MSPITFSALAMSMVAKVVFGCDVTMDYSFFGANLLENWRQCGEIKKFHIC